MDCGQKSYTMKAKCPVCGAAIGGATDQDTPLFTPTKDGVRRGHCLGGLADAVAIGLGQKPVTVGGMFELEVKASLADHRLSPPIACLLRIVMHACMFGACVADPAHDKVIGRWLWQHDPLTGLYFVNSYPMMFMAYIYIHVDTANRRWAVHQLMPCVAVFFVLTLV